MGDIKKPLKAFRLNPAGKEVWLLCDGQTEKAEVLRRAAAKLSVSEAEAGRFIDQLMESGVVTAGGDICLDRNAVAHFKNGRGVILRPLKMLNTPRPTPS